MVKKVQKVKKQRNEKPKKENGFKFGRNLGSFLIVISGLVLLFFLIFIPYSYISVYNKNKVEPFATESIYTDYLANVEKNSATSEHVYKDVKRMSGKDFDLFDITFKCLEINSESDKMRFSLEVRWNKNTSKLGDSESLIKLNNSSSTVMTCVGVASEWVKFEKYYSQQSMTVTNSKDTDRNVIRTSTITGLLDYPAKAPTWPVNINVKAPNAYVFLTFGYNVSNSETGKNGKIHEAYILEYTFDDYFTKDTTGAFPNR